MRVMSHPPHQGEIIKHPNVRTGNRPLARRERGDSASAEEAKSVSTDASSSTTPPDAGVWQPHAPVWADPEG